MGEVLDMAIKHSNDFNGQAKKLIDKIEQLRGTKGLSGDDFISLISSEFYEVWQDAYNDSVLDHQSYTKGQ